MISNECTTFFINLITVNKQKLKSYPPPFMNTDGTIINSFQVLLNIFINNNVENETSLERLIFINTDFCRIKELNIFDKINKESKIEDLDTQGDYSKFPVETKSFFLCHFLLREALEGLNKRNQDNIRQANTLSQSPQSPEFKQAVTNLHSLYAIFKCPKFCKKLIHFLETTVYLCFTRNNSKYSINKLFTEGKNYFNDFYKDFYHYIQDEQSESFNCFQELIIENVYKTIKFLRECNPDIFSKHMEESKSFVYFSLIYSSKTEIIKNPYVRAESLDIVEYFFINEYQQNNKQTNKLIQIFQDPLIKEIFIYSLIRVFIDTERLGGSNQFYEKFNHRYKILLLIDSVKSQISIDDQILFYATNFKDDCIMMVNYLINDLTFMADETIEKFQEIKQYEDLKADFETFNALSEDEKKSKEESYQDNIKKCKNFVPFFKSYLQFTITISNTCQKIILEYKLGQKLANLLNYLLDMFASKHGNTLKVMNLTQYKFNPKEFLSFIIQAYASFSEYKEFWMQITSDERSYKFDNFRRALNLRTKISVNYKAAEEFSKLVNGILSIKDEINSNMIDCEDAPEEYLDPITAELMEDPVMMPYSKQIVERHTIEQHLLSDPIDPFSRSPLNKKDLIPCPELKEKISIYRQQKINEMKNK
jgi:hypothetical protein